MLSAEHDDGRIWGVTGNCDDSFLGLPFVGAMPFLREREKRRAAMFTGQLS